MPINILKIAIIMPKLSAAQRSVTQTLIAFSLLALLTSCDLPNNQSEAEANANQASVTPNSLNSMSHLLLGTGSVQGVYFPIGGVICRLLNRHKDLHKIRCSLESTGGSIYNLKELRDGNFDLVFAQSDWQFHAYHGTSAFEKQGANKNLRAVFALEADPLAIIVRDNSDINSFDDLADRRVSFGYTRSLQHRIVNDLLEAKGWNNNNFKEVRPMSDIKQVAQLCNGEIEAITLLTSSLNDNLRSVADDCLIRLVAVDGPEVSTAIKAKPYYRTGLITKNMYSGDQDIMSFGLGATFVASESTSPKAIYHVVKEVVENFRDFKSLHPSLEGLDKEELSYAGISIPLHPGAIRYYKEARLLNKQE
ncbi:MAG: TRAP transporter TAXI family solute receptor [Arenicella sp.]|jgi:TRAP transporter TAXI family solute receptor